jgi:TatD DNase family protein
MILADSHAHLYAEEFNADRNAMMQNAVNNGVQYFFLPNIDEDSIRPMLQMEKDFPGKCFPMMGLHPCSVKENIHEQLALIENWLRKKAFVGVGETGLDYYWDTTFKKEQIISFEKHIEWAIEFKSPLIIHTRNSFEDTFRLVQKHHCDDLKGVFHCFSGNAEDAEKVMSLKNFKMGIGGVLTFKNSGLDKVVENIPLDFLVLETDSPYLAPVPHRGKRNEPAFLEQIAFKLAQIKNIDVQTLSEITTKNTLELFNIPSNAKA